jgi:hypothetical protein
MTMLDVLLGFPAALAVLAVLVIACSPIDLVQLIWSLMVISSFAYLVWRLGA